MRIVDEYVALRVVVYDVLLPAATHEEAGTLLSLFGPAERNTYRRRR